IRMRIIPRPDQHYTMSGRSATPVNAAGRSFLINPPTFIDYKGVRFLIVDAPSNNNLPMYLKEFKRYNVTDVVRCCEPTYSKGPLEEQGIKVHDWVFGDGEAPPSSIIQQWLDLIQSRFGDKDHGDNEKKNKAIKACIATHCVAGLGRAPVLVAIALIEEGMAPLDSVAYIRERRRGAINNKQLKFIEGYKRRDSKFTPPSNVTVPSSAPAPKVTRKNVIETITKEQISQLDTDGRSELFSKKNPNAVRPGSILLVENYTSKSKDTTATFMGVVIAIRRKGLDTNFTLRNIVLKVGVEQRFSLYSPMLKSIKVLSPAKEKFRRAKLFYLRDKPGKVFQPLQGLWKQEQQKDM
ncbi:hypothetical protein BZG36_00147, partial [Bifiguratus adelaidae]